MSTLHCIVLPGWGMEASIWSPLCQPLSNKVKLSFIDWRGVESPEEIKARVMDRIMSEPEQTCILMGWSLGAMAALDAAAACPDRVKGMILFGATSRFVTLEDGNNDYQIGWDARVLRRMKRRLELEKETALSDFYQMMFSSAERKEGWSERFLHVSDSHFKGDSTASLLHGLDYLIHGDLRGRLPYIKAPMLLIHGEEDVVCPPAASAYIAEQTGGLSKVIAMPGVGHVPFFTKSDECLTAVIEFMQEGEQDD